MGGAAQSCTHSPEIWDKICKGITWSWSVSSLLSVLASLLSPGASLFPSGASLLFPDLSFAFPASFAPSSAFPWMPPGSPFGPSDLFAVFPGPLISLASFLPPPASFFIFSGSFLASASSLLVLPLAVGPSWTVGAPFSFLMLSGAPFSLLLSGSPFFLLLSGAPFSSFLLPSGPFPLSASPSFTGPLLQLLLGAGAGAGGLPPGWASLGLFSGHDDGFAASGAPG